MSVLVDFELLFELLDWLCIAKIKRNRWNLFVNQTSYIYSIEDYGRTPSKNFKEISILK